MVMLLVQPAKEQKSKLSSALSQIGPGELSEWHSNSQFLAEIPKD
jgi:hypothetical protein